MAALANNNATNTIIGMNNGNPGLHRNLGFFLPKVHLNITVTSRQSFLTGYFGDVLEIPHP
jgi:hypothetical protein